MLVLRCALLVVVAVLLGAAPAHAQDRTVTLVGSLQSELGCPGDWQPEGVLVGDRGRHP